jgi:large subunit ribosomal protein L29
MSTAKDFREKSAEELNAQEAELRKSLFDAQYKHAGGQLEDTASIRRTRRDLARLLTVKTQKKSAEKKGSK